MRKIDRYIMQYFSIGMLPVMLLLLALFSFLPLSDALRDVGKGSYDLLDAFKLVAFTTPNRVIDLLPVTALLGGLAGLGMLANHGELVVIQAAGWSKPRIALPITLVALALVGLMLVLQFYVVPASEREAIRIKSKALENTKVDLTNRLEFWTRSKDYFVRVRKVEYDRSLSDIEVYRFDSAGRLTQVIQASHADVVDDNNWRLTGVSQSDLGEYSADEKQIETMTWPALLNREQAATLVLPMRALTPLDLFRYVAYLKKNKLNTHQYRVIFWQKMSIPFVLVAMALLSLPYLLGSVRHVSQSQRLVTGTLAGTGVYLVQQLSGNLAGVLQLNPSLTMMTPAILLMGFAIYKILGTGTG